ncbi:uncharacterized protein [Linepithema humile]|uniref:uncharacterized protein n=1 Tax=Linepithema humile TaxID=83485 RepID=UPI0006237FC3|nr:PREDICTED: uncharacterized protein LOC105668057 [Linepithema humile]XP_012215652.1 PREDICTED: uncharacterized protein LOC105668057 [Linepithema humile]
MEFITLELRPRLQSCNIFIAMRKDLCLKNVQIKLLESSIVLILKDCSINFLLPSIKIIPISLSTLNIMNNWICFRLQTAPVESVFGSFSTEVVNSDMSVQLLSSSSSPILNNIKLLFKTSKCTMLCACCKNTISNSVSFKRFLPLPDIEYDQNEWFCCKHNSDISHDVQPQKWDYLYGSCFSVLDKNIFDNNVHIDSKAMTCTKCLLHIGTFHTRDLFKIWNCCVDYKPQSDVLSTVNATNPLSDFLLLLKGLLGEILGEEIILQTSVNKQIHCLLIKPMDYKLNLITEPNHKLNSDTCTIVLKQMYVAKILYKYETSKIASNKLNATYHEVGLPIIEAGLKYLLSSTKRLPHAYRAAEDCFFGYIVLQETD